MQRNRTPRARRSTSRGAALLTAMIIVALVTTMTASIVWQQWRAVQVEAAERGRAQSAEMLTGALTWAMLILREDRRSEDTLADQWANELKEAKLSTLLQADGGAEGAAARPDPFLQGRFTDAQARWNLRRLVDARGDIVAPELAVLRRLCLGAGISSDVADRIARALRDAWRPESPDSPPDPPVVPRTLAQLAWLGLEPDTLQRLEPYVVLLPDGDTPLNLNTATAEVIAAVLDVDGGTASRLVRERPFRALDRPRELLGRAEALPPGQVDIKSRWFWLHGQMRLDDRIVVQRTLLRRSADPGQPIEVFFRERISAMEPAPSDPTPAAR
jgi:general secretion pathway protein K